ncbi:MAG: site-2 protease family protein [Chloroflexota bacterium]|nr:site-2 protease family protein [Chloroflexota bacterium]
MQRNGFRIGTLFGIDIRIDWSWLLIFVLMTGNLGFAFASMHGGWSVPLRWAVALVGALLFFGSVLAHEMAHSLVARSQGTPVSNITLFLFGGVSNIQEEPDSPAKEFFMAIVGPVTSLLIGGILILIANLVAGPMVARMAGPMETIQELGPVATLMLWLGSVNVFLGLFNLVPGFPLDGGRVIRSIFWALTDDLRRGTFWAMWLGQGIAWLMIMAGIFSIFGVKIPLVGGGFLNGLWLAFIGWFLSNAGIRSYQHVVVQDVLGGTPVSRMMRRDPPTVSSFVSVDSFVHDHVMRSDDYGFPVVDDGELVGIITLDDVRAISRGEWTDLSVRDIMTKAEDLITVGPDEDAADALQKLINNQVRQLPVMEDEKLVGLVRRRDIVRWLEVTGEAERGLGLGTLGET